jgi:hypothetical protein
MSRRYPLCKNDGKLMWSLVHSNISNLPRKTYLDFDKSVQDHGTTGIQIDLILLHRGFLSGGIWILACQHPTISG